MKVLLTVQGYPPELSGGTERHVQSLARGLVARGHEVTVLAGTLEWSHELRRSTADDLGVRVVKIHRDDFHYERWDRLYHPRVSRLVSELLAEMRPDVMHVHHWLRLTGDLVRQGVSHDVPVVVTLHDFTVSCPTVHRVLDDGRWCETPVADAPCGDCSRVGETSELLEPKLRMRREDFANELSLASRVLTLSRSQAERMRSILEPDHPALETQPFTSALALATSPAPAPPPPLRVVTLGRIGEYKGQQVLLRALRRCRNKDRIEVHVHGSFESPEDEARLAELAHGSRVVWHGGYDHAELERTSYHIAVLPSLGHETYGLVLDEVRMLGLPALVSDRGAYRERLGDAGAVFPAGDDAELARLLDDVFDHPEIIERWRSRVTRPESFDSILDFAEELYEQAVEVGCSKRADRFDLAGHLELEHARGDLLERSEHALREQRGRDHSTRG